MKHFSLPLIAWERVPPVSQIFFQENQIIFFSKFQVYLDAPLIVNGLSVRWKGYINMEKLDGVGGFRFDDDSARVRIEQ